MNNVERLNLQKMINENDVKDETENIREKKHSSLIRDDVIRFVELKKKYFRLEKSNPGEFEKICITRCIFLFNNYTDIFNKIKTNTLNLTIMDKFLNILKRIEDGELDQHEGSYLVGQHLKELYIDSAMRNQQKMEANERKKKVQKKPNAPEKNISYKDFKKMQN